jgi:hypothetical protein
MSEDKYTLGQFELDMENASPDRMADILTDAANQLDMTDPIVKDTVNKYREDLMDIKAQMEVEENDRCNKDIDGGTLVLYKCIKDYPFESFNVGQNYYVKIDDIASDLKDKWNSDEQIASLISNMSPLIWIYYDNGIGTLKKRTLFVNNGNFSEFFEKV